MRSSRRRIFRGTGARCFGAFQLERRHVGACKQSADPYPQATADLWRAVEETVAGWAPYRDAALDRWHRRAALSGGAAAARSGLKGGRES
jgi:hypothetical protein